MMTGAKFEKLVEIMSALRGPNGCPWDKEQTFASLKPMMVEEIYEALEAIDNNDFDHLSEELGDVLLHVVFQAQMGKEAAKFDIDSVIDGICTKLIRRHPHVFAGETAGTAEDVLRNWQVIKEAEKAEKAKSENAASTKRESVLDGIPGKLPALHEAHQISARAVRVGFDWPNIDGVFEKLREEVRELQEAIDAGKQDAIEDEVGDLFFVMVNIARTLKVDSESALKRANRKFKSRFQLMEAEAAANGKRLDESSANELEDLWNRAKAKTLSQ